MSTESNYPFLRLSREHDVDYGIVVCCAEGYRRLLLGQFGRGSDEYWFNWAEGARHGDWTPVISAQVSNEIWAKMKAFLVSRGDISETV